MVLKWHTGIREGYGQGVLTVVSGSVGMQCQEDGLNCIMMYLFTIHEILRWT